MNKIDPTVVAETKYISLCVTVLSALMQAVFLVIGKWNYTVLLGNLLGAAAVILNFFLMGISVQKALEKDEKEAKSVMKLSQTYRNLMLLVIIVVGIYFPCFNTWAVIIPVIFPRIAIGFRSFLDKKQ